MGDTGNVLHLVEQAVRRLAVGEQEINWRLRNAYLYHLSYVFPEHVPEDLAPLLKSIHDRLTKKPSYKGQGTVDSAVYRMRRSTAVKIANDMFELYVALLRRSQ